MKMSAHIIEKYPDGNSTGEGEQWRLIINLGAFARFQLYGSWLGQ